MVQIKIIGAKRTRAYIKGVQKRSLKEGPFLAKRVAFATARRIKTVIKTEARYVGAYHRQSGRGLADSIVAKNVGKKKWRVGPDLSWPALKRPSGKSIAPPAEYGVYVEARKKYFSKGLRQAASEVRKEVKEAAKRITRGK